MLTESGNGNPFSHFELRTLRFSSFTIMLATGLIHMAFMILTFDISIPISFRDFFLVIKAVEVNWLLVVIHAFNSSTRESVESGGSLSSRTGCSTEAFLDSQDRQRNPVRVRGRLWNPFFCIYKMIA